MPFAHHNELCDQAYAYETRLNNKDRKREEIYNSNEKGNRYKSQQEESIKLNGRKKRTNCKKEDWNGKNVRRKLVEKHNVYQQNRKVNGYKEGTEKNEKTKG